jgi:hypothetical protein
MGANSTVDAASTTHDVVLVKTLGTAVARSDLSCRAKDVSTCGVKSVRVPVTVRNFLGGILWLSFLCLL